MGIIFELKFSLLTNRIRFKLSEQKLKKMFKVASLHGNTLFASSLHVRFNTFKDTRRIAYFFTSILYTLVKFFHGGNWPGIDNMLEV